MGMFTAQELEELRKFDEEVDKGGLTYEDYLLEDLVEELLFPTEKAKAPRKRPAAPRKPRKVDKEAERKRKQEWYKKNRERVRLQQKDYQLRSGRCKKGAAAMAAAV